EPFQTPMPVLSPFVCTLQVTGPPLRSAKIQGLYAVNVPAQPGRTHPSTVPVPSAKPKSATDPRFTRPAPSSATPRPEPPIPSPNFAVAWVVPLWAPRLSVAFVRSKV